MAAIKVDGTVEFEGQVVTTDIDTAGYPESWTLGEMYFIVAENPQIRGIGNTIYNFRRVYINKPSYRFEIRSARIVPVYKDVKIDASRMIIDFYENAKACDNGFRHTLINWAMTTEPLCRRDVLITTTGVPGYVFQAPPHTQGYYLVMDKVGEIHRARRESLMVLNPTQYLTWPMTCLECHSLEGRAMSWVTTANSFNRPLCGLCIDYYLDNGILDIGDRESWDNLTGPYIYDSNQPNTCLIEPGVTPLQTVIQEFRNRSQRIGRIRR